MKYLLGILMGLGFTLTAFSQTENKEQPQEPGITCFQVDEANILCFMEGSESDPDANNDGYPEKKFNEDPSKDNLEDKDVPENLGNPEEESVPPQSGTQNKRKQQENQNKPFDPSKDKNREEQNVTPQDDDSGMTPI